MEVRRVGGKGRPPSVCCRYAARRAAQKELCLLPQDVALSGLYALSFVLPLFFDTTRSLVPACPGVRRAARVQRRAAAMHASCPPAVPARPSVHLLMPVVQAGVVQW